MDTLVIPQKVDPTGKRSDLANRNATCFPADHDVHIQEYPHAAHVTDNRYA